MIESLNTKSPSQSFWHSINILLTKPHVINKKLWGSKTWTRLACKAETLTWELPSQINRLQHNLSNEKLDKFTKDILQIAKLQLCTLEETNNLFEIILLELFPKTFREIQVFQLIIINHDNLSVTFYDITQDKARQKLYPDFTYTFQLLDNEVVLKAECDENSASYLWLKNTLLPQIVKWRETANNSTNQNICKDSLALISQHKYYLKYNELKLKYGKAMVKIWPECTDPSKFVYEDVAIATYLILLWEDIEKTHSKKETFVDLGCGNGLLVYILTKEGYSGVGIDVRKRNIWDMYPSEVKLEEKTIVPSDSSLFPNTDWIIGNHSDELTPWIPVIAAKSSFECNFFLLPCCAYNFNGTKYQRKDSSKSQYTDYLAYIKELSRECGFDVEMDRLKIPSTKRICLISKGRSYPIAKYDEYCKRIQGIIERDSISLSNENQLSWVKDFKPRETMERVRNCTQLDKSIVSSIVKCIVNYLLEDSNAVDTVWNAGKTVELSELIRLIPQDQLKHLKAECGGIQTLLKNNHNIFKVQSGKVQLRYPKTVQEINCKTRDVKIKCKPCWFYSNHPQGCPLLDSCCSFLHVKI